MKNAKIYTIIFFLQANSKCQESILQREIIIVFSSYSHSYHWVFPCNQRAHCRSWGWKKSNIEPRRESTYNHVFSSLNNTPMIWNSITSGSRFNIKMTSYQYRKCHCGDKTILRPSYLHNGISYTGKMTSLYWIRALGLFAFHFLGLGYPLPTRPLSRDMCRSLSCSRREEISRVATVIAITGATVQYHHRGIFSTAHQSYGSLPLGYLL